MSMILPFYEKVMDYENLIIDITNNLGGSMRYFVELVAAPLAGEPLTVPTYQMFKGGENNRTFLRMEEGIASGLYRPVSELPALPKLNREDAADCDWFLREDYTVEPTGDGFDGKIWLLVSENNYSSSEYAAMFSKASGFCHAGGSKDWRGRNRDRSGISDPAKQRTGGTVQPHVRGDGGRHRERRVRHRARYCEPRRRKRAGDMPESNRAGKITVLP